MKKQIVLEKHKRLSMVADELNNYKTEVSYNKRRNNLTIQRIRSSRASPSARLSLTMPRNFEKSIKII